MIVSNPHLTIKGGLLWEIIIRTSIDQLIRMVAPLWEPIDLSIMYVRVVTALPKE